MAAHLLLGSAVLAQVLPPDNTPGVVNHDVTQANIKQTICASKWTSSVRPASSYTSKMKLSDMADRNLAGTPKNYEEDHRVPLELGGHPTDPANLWAQPWAKPYGAHEKDRLENAVRKDVCKGDLSLAAGRGVFLGNFWDEYRRRYEPKRSHAVMRWSKTAASAVRKLGVR